MRAREEEAIRKAAEFDKLQALIDQKLQLTERELADCRAKLGAREAEVKELTKEMYSAKKETQALQALLSRSEQEKADEIRAIR